MSVCLVGSDMNYEAITFPPFPSATTVRYKNLLRNRRKITWKSLPKLDIYWQEKPTSSQPIIQNLHIH